MGRPTRTVEGGLIYHVLNRANARQTIFEKDADYEAFERILQEAVARVKMRLLAYCVMPNHWHLLAWPRNRGDLSRFVGWLTLTHTQRWHAHRQTTGSGHLYQGRFKSFLIQEDFHFLTACRYVERNPLRANLVERAEDWRWGSLWRWHSGSVQEKALLFPWPVRRTAGWIEHVNEPLSADERQAVRRSAVRGNPYGDERWSTRMVRRFGLEATLRPRGRPRKEEKGS